MNAAFGPAFSRGDIQLNWNTNTRAWNKGSRRANPEAVYSAFGASSAPSPAVMRRKAAVLVGILQWMNDECPMAVGSTNPRLFERPWTEMAHSPATEAYGAIERGSWPW